MRSGTELATAGGGCDSSAWLTVTVANCRCLPMVPFVKHGQFAPITFNQALMSQPPPAVASSVPNVMPDEPDVTAPPPTVAAPAMPVRSPFVPPVLNQQAPSPHVRGVIQRNPRLPSRRPKSVLGMPRAQQ